jgi:hypothetical protein
MAVLHAGDDKISVGSDCGLRHLVASRGAKLAVIDNGAFGIELGDIGIVAARARLTRGDGGADLAADIDIAASIHADRIGLIVR